jgi:hypothetical protein
MADSVTHVFGCRSPKSKGAGRWDGAFVYARGGEGETAVGALFELGVDYVGYPTLEEAVVDYDGYVAMGWTPMGPDDLTKTTGVTVGPDTILVPKIKAT